MHSTGIERLCDLWLPWYSTCIITSCRYCPGGPDSDFEYSTQSYTGYEPTSMRAIRARYNPYLQARHRIDQVRCSMPCRCMDMHMCAMQVCAIKSCTCAIKSCTCAIKSCHLFCFYFFNNICQLISLNYLISFV